MKNRLLKKTKDWISVGEKYHLTVIDHPDGEHLVKYLNDKGVSSQTCSIPYPYRMEDAMKFIDQSIAFETAEGQQSFWAIRMSSGELIGGIGLLYDEGVQADSSELGYWLGRPFWNQGIMTEVLHSLSAHIFKEGIIQRLVAKVFVGNEASRKVLEKSGFREIAFENNAFIKAGIPIDAHVYELTEASYIPQ